MPDAMTTRWIRNASDEKAVAAGCRFDEARGQHVIDFAAKYLRLYEGEQAGQPLIAQDWQIEVTMRLFGWEKFSTRWGRWVRRFTRASIWVPKKNKKALALDTMLPTPTGWTTIGEVRPGDRLFSEAGKAITVVDVHPIIVDDESYLVKFSNGETVRCNGEHLWETTALQNSVVGAKGKSFGGNQWTGSKDNRWKPTKVRTTAEIYETQRRRDGACNHSLAMPLSIELPDCDLPIDPYVFGAWLGDGDSDGARMTCSKEDYQHWKDEFARCGVELRDRQDKPDSKACRAALGTKWGPFRTTLRTMGVLKNKHIPIEYLRASKAQRLSLLQGLMDTDGCIDKAGKNLTFVSKYQHLAESVGELLSSLGVKYRLTARQTKIGDGRTSVYYWLQFHSFADIPVFRMKRKRLRQRCRESLVMKPRSRTVQIISVEKISAVPMRCITVSNPSGLFLFGRTMLPTHNSPTLAWWALYLTVADGEMGQKVFFGAKDGAQAREIAGKHAFEMVMSSPDLLDECSLNKNLMQVTHEPTRSILKPMSSGDSRTQQSKEGINGSILIDETHVVDADFIARVCRAGISRSEPLHIEVSTAGKDPMSYGKTQYDYGKLVEKGDVEDSSFLYVAYEAPQTLSDEELAKDPVKYGKMANPAWGHTVAEEEYLADYNRSKVSISDLADFKTYRLNIWQKSRNPWLRGGDWDKCGNADLKLEDFRGQPCWIGLDKSKTRDMSAIVLTFKQLVAGTMNYYQFPFFWLPEETAKRHNWEVPFLNWAHAGHLVLIPGEVIEDRWIEDKVSELAEVVSIQEQYYDKTYAHDITLRLEETHGIARIEFPQTMMMFSGPVDDYERVVIQGQLHHPDHPVMNWQAGHAETYSDAGGRKRLVKPRNNDIKKIDGMVAGVMSLFGAMNGAVKHESVYKRRHREGKSLVMTV